MITCSFLFSFIQFSTYTGFSVLNILTKVGREKTNERVRWEWDGSGKSERENDGGDFFFHRNTVDQKVREFILLPARLGDGTIWKKCSLELGWTNVNFFQFYLFILLSFTRFIRKRSCFVVTFSSKIFLFCKCIIQLLTSFFLTEGIFNFGGLLTLVLRLISLMLPVY